jgi:type II secretory pathway pseudopilin PulG
MIHNKKRIAGIGSGAGRKTGEHGFAIIEFLVSSMILLIVTSAVFVLLTESQREASYQVEIQSVLNNTSIAMQTIERYLRQAGNNPFTSGFSGVTIISATELRIQSDMKGSCGASNPDKGDPDGDIEDSEENVLIRFNPQSHSIEVLSGGGPPMIIASYISDLSFRYYNKDGSIASDGSEVRRISISVSGTSAVPNPQTHQPFGITVESEVCIMT